MFFFYVILLIIFILTILTLFITIQIHIENLKFSTDKTQGRFFNKEYKIKIQMYIFKKIKICELDINKIKLEKPKIRKTISKLEEKIAKDRKKIDIKIIKNLKHLNIELKQLKLKIFIGLTDASHTAISVGLISTIISIILKILKQEKSQWDIISIYQNRDLLKIDLNCIFCVKMIHIIYTIYVIKKEGEKQNGRSSNRRNYAYNNE